MEIWTGQYRSFTVRSRFLFVMRADDAIRRLVSAHVDFPAAVGADDAFVGPHPEEAADSVSPSFLNSNRISYFRRKSRRF